MLGIAAGTGILGFLEFIKSAVLVVRIYITEVAYFQNHFQKKKNKRT